MFRGGSNLGGGGVEPSFILCFSTCLKHRFVELF
jgi:hypothetical protein